MYTLAAQHIVTLGLRSVLMVVFEAIFIRNKFTITACKHVMTRAPPFDVDFARPVRPSITAAECHATLHCADSTALVSLAQPAIRTSLRSAKMAHLFQCYAATGQAHMSLLSRVHKLT